MYNPKSIEKKWQELWKKNNTFHVSDDPSREKRYVLDMFPYPSNEGLHVGHPEGYTASDIYARYLRMKGYNVLHPMGWDAFGLPAENYAIKKGVHPRETTEKNISVFRRQIQSLGFSYDWDREINTSDPSFYRWTQWLFLQLYKHGLAYKRRAPVNWCQACQTVLANEQVIDGACERCKHPVIQKELEQWFFSVTQYADELLAKLDTLDWPEPIKLAQRNWIGKSEGAQINFQLSADSLQIQVFTTRPDTIYGATYMVLAPEHPIIDDLKSSITNWDEVEAYRAETRKKNELERVHLEKEKTGVQLKGVMALNPATNEEIPLWIADYVLASYGMGAIMAVPAHDERDFEFAQKYDLHIRIVICPHYPAPTCPILDMVYIGDGHLVESGEFTGMRSEDAKKKITAKLGGQWVTTYRLRDWLISRQRYWGAPIPILYCDTCGEQGVPEIDLPVLLPTDVDFRPMGESPLTRSKDFHAVACPQCGGPARRESDTMDTFVCSSWYFLRYTDPRNNNAFADPEKITYWLKPARLNVAEQNVGGVDMYVGGAEHAVLHLLYARFFTKALRDSGFINFDEPFTTLRNQGMILGQDGEKMSKSRGNVINPDEVIGTFGADAMRMYEMFMGPFEDAKPWNTNGIVGVRRFLEKVWRIADMLTDDDLPELEKKLHQTIKKVTDDIEKFKFNTAISALMIFANACEKAKTVPRHLFSTFILLLAPFAPHAAEELHERLGSKESLAYEPWPTYNERFLVEDTKTVVVQVNGKIRDQLEVPAEIGEAELTALAQSRPAVQKWLEGKKITKTVVIKGKLINFVIE